MNEVPELFITLLYVTGRTTISILFIQKLAINKLGKTTNITNIE